MTKIKCADCSFRAKYDNNPKSILGRVWRWHINWCPGWKIYIKSLPDKDKNAILKKYNLK
jgi:hypothetical protein